MASREEKDFELDIESGVNLSSNMVKFGGGVVDYDDIETESLVDKSAEGGEDSGGRVTLGEKHKKNSRKPPKPPRPPKGPSILDAADRKLVREVAELAMRKRARVERIKALKKMKAVKASSFNSGLYAMVITLVFFLVITFQGLSSRSIASVRLHGSPELAVAASESLISVQYYKDSSAYESNGPGSGSLSFAEEQVSNSGPGEEVGKIVVDDMTM